MYTVRTLLLVLLVLVAVVAAPVLAGDSTPERNPIFQKFDHTFHRHALKRADRTCVSCHHVGTPLTPEGAGDAGPDASLFPPESICHECHAPGEGGLGEGDGVLAAPHRCNTCHDTVEKPDSHAIGWLDLHGGFAREGTTTCMNCHNRATCADCHDRRQTAGQKVHDRSWLTVHGIAVRSDPAACDSCHVQSECTSCHASTSGWGRNP